ncbi:hypothetical protein [Streptomyces zaomyceticus]|uniref:hypothetical protein n=1 Tax=Streptomyces zaomyceticus TaxID=68286 RepID=UPI0037A87A57
MREQAEHTGRADSSLTVEADLGPALLQVATAVEEHAEDEAERDATAALAVRHTLPAIEVAAMTNRLLTRVEGLAVGVERIPVCCRGASGIGALATWERLKEQGPAPDPLGNWSYLRDLAHSAHGMVHSLREHRAAEQPQAFVGRSGMPPLAPDAP